MRNTKEVLCVIANNSKYVCGFLGIALIYKIVNRLIDKEYNATIDIKNSKISIYK